MHRLKHGQQLLRLFFPRDGKVGLALALHEQVALLDPDRLVRQSANALDVVRFGPARKLENTHLETLGITELIREFLHQDPVAAIGFVRLALGVARADLHREAAHGARPPDRPNPRSTRS